MNNCSLQVEGWVKLTDIGTGEILVDKHNAIHYENLSYALAQAICSGPLNSSESTAGFIETIRFGNGGTDVSQTGVITYKTPNNIGSAASLYSETYSKTINQNFGGNLDSANNNLQILAVPGRAFTDILVSCLLDYNEPGGQQAFDNANDFSAQFVFDELGLQAVGGRLLTHVIFHPVQKSVNRKIQVDYTIRVQTLSNLVTASNALPD